MNNSVFKMKTVPFIIASTIILYASICFSVSNQALNITHYKFGEIIINEKAYTDDITIWPDGKIAAGPDDMHFLHLNDLDELIDSGIKKLVIGTGYEGAVEMDIRSKLKKGLKARGIELITMDTQELVKFLNQKGVRDFLVFVHLNC